MPDRPIVLADVKRLNAQPGDVLVFRYDGRLARQDYQDLSEQLAAEVRAVWGDDVRAVLLASGLSLDQVVAGDITGAPV